MSSHHVSLSRIIGAIFIISGTCIGAGMLALPVAGSQVGLLPSLSVMLCTYIVMTLGGLFYLEASLWFKHETHINSLSERFMGRFAKWVCCAIYLFIAFASLIAYLSEGAKIIYLNIEKYFGIVYAPEPTYYAYLIGMITLLLFSTKSISKINTVLVIGMVVAYFAMIGNLKPHMDAILLEEHNWDTPVILGLTPLMLSAFSYPGIVPSLVVHLKHNVNAVRAAIIGGTTLSLFIYAIWIAVVFSVVPHTGEGQNTLSTALAEGSSAIIPVQNLFGKEIIAASASLFGFLAITTSFIGISYGLLHFLADSFKRHLHVANRVWLSVLIAIPTLIGCLTLDRVFIHALNLTGGIGDSTISLMFPALIVLIGRYRDKLKGTGAWYCNPAVLIAVILFGAYQITAEIISLI